MTTKSSVGALTLIWVAVLFASSPAVADPTGPGGGTEGQGGNGGFGVTVTISDDGGYVYEPDAPSTTVVSRTVTDCGPSGIGHTQLSAVNNVCAMVWLQCDGLPRTGRPKATVTDQLVRTRYADGHSNDDVACRVSSATQRPQVTADMARAEAEKLLPHPGIGTAPAGGATLVNIETVLWVKTDGDLRLGTVTLLGYGVGLRAHLQRVDWDFGDGATDTTDGAGTVYTHEDPCRTAECPNYFGHTYRRTGPVTVAAQLVWSGQFQVDGGPWRDIPGTVNAAAASESLRVKEARGILVGNP